MSSSTTTLAAEAVLARLCGATGADREIDLLISVAVNFRGVWDGGYVWKWGAGGDEVEGWDGNKRRAFLDPVQFVPHWTQSVDKALLLVPTNFYVKIERFSDGWYAKIAANSMHPTWDGNQKPAAIAICIAIFRARIAGII